MGGVFFFKMFWIGGDGGDIINSNMQHYFFLKVGVQPWKFYFPINPTPFSLKPSRRRRFLLFVISLCLVSNEVLENIKKLPLKVVFVLNIVRGLQLAPKYIYRFEGNGHKKSTAEFYICFICPTSIVGVRKNCFCPWFQKGKKGGESNPNHR